MKKNILSYLEETTLNFPSKIIFADNVREITYENFLKEAKMVGTSLLENNIENNPIVIFIDKTVNCLSSMFGIVYSGNFYVIIDTQMPIDRINLILNTLDAKIMITDKKNYDKAVSINNNLKLYVFEEMLKSIDDEKLLKVREKMIDTDPLYVLFTSGSTGNPKGTVITHKSVIAYANWYKETFDINENTIFGSQTPFYFSTCRIKNIIGIDMPLILPNVNLCLHRIFDVKLQRQHFLPLGLTFGGVNKCGVQQRFDQLGRTIEIVAAVKTAQATETQIPQTAVSPIVGRRRQIDQIRFHHPYLKLVGKTYISSPGAAADVNVIFAD